MHFFTKRCTLRHRLCTQRREFTSSIDVSARVSPLSICLFGSVGERTQLRRRELGEVAAELADLSILTSDNPGTEDPMQIIDEIAAAFGNNRKAYIKIPDRTDAIRCAISMLTKDDILVLAGKGHEEYQLIGREKVPFSEREIIRDVLADDPILLPK